MNFTAAKVRIARIIDNLSKQRQENALQYCDELISLVNERLEKKGEGSDGQKFPLYSKNKLAYRTALKVIQKSNRPSAGKNLKKDQTSYEDIRKLLGLPIDRRTHVFTANMLKSIRPTVIENTSEKTVVEIKSASQENQLKLNQNSFNMKTNLLSPNKNEIDFLEAVNKERINNAIIS